MDEHLEDVLRRVASGELSPEDAEPLIAALTAEEPPAARPRVGSSGPPHPPPLTGRMADQPGRAVRVQVTEGGRTVVNLRIPMSWTGLASLVPGLSGAQLDGVTDALRKGERGRILDIQDADGDGVVISTE